MKGATDYMIKKQHITIKKETEDENVIKKIPSPPDTMVRHKVTGTKGNWTKVIFSQLDK